jgi:hypothetical protein
VLGPNEHQRNTYLGIVEPAPAHPRRDRAAGVDALAEGTDSFTKRDWLFLIGHPREKVFSLHNLIVKVSLPRPVQRLSIKATNQKIARSVILPSSLSSV